MKHKPHHNGPNNWLVSPLSAQASCTPDMEFVVAVSSDIVQSVFNNLLEVSHNILVLRQVPVLSEHLVPRTYQTWRWLSLEPIQNILDMSTGHVIIPEKCLLRMLSLDRYSSLMIE